MAANAPATAKDTAAPAPAAAASGPAAAAAAGAAPASAAAPRACAICKKTAAEANLAKLKVCGGCGEVAYCSREHQMEHWKTHKSVCKQKHKAVQATDIEVLWDDQKNINAFGKLNTRLGDLDDELKDKRNELENHKDAVDLLDTTLDPEPGHVKLRVGEVFIDCDDEGDAETAVKGKLKGIKAKIASLQTERDSIVAEMTKLKALLYAKFGKSINLEVKDDAA